MLIEKNYKISIIRLFALVSVIFCHTFEWIGHDLGYGEWIKIIGNYLAGGVQIFLFISGYLYGMRFRIDNSMKFIKTNFIKILIPYYIYVFFVVFPVYTFINPQLIESGIRGYLNVILCYGFPSGMVHFWFIPYILFCYLITPLLYYIRESITNDSKNVIEFISRTIILIMIVCYINFVYQGFFVFSWISCYIIGFFYASKKTEIDVFKYNILLYIIVVLIGVSTNIIRYYVAYVQISQLIKGTRKYEFYTWALVFYALSILIICKHLFNRVNINGNRFLDFTDKYSYCIYISHMIFVKGALSLLSVTKYVFMNILIMLAVTTISGVALKRISEMVEKGIRNKGVRCRENEGIIENRY